MRDLTTAQMAALAKSRLSDDLAIAVDEYIQSAKSELDREIRKAIAVCDFSGINVEYDRSINTMEDRVIITIKRPFSSTE